jgi:hypothetical protein
MCARKHWILGIALITSLGLDSLAIGQERKPADPGADDANLVEIQNLHPFQRAIYLSSRRGAEWLWQSNRPDGVFVPGHIPALNVVMEDDHFLRQAGGACALARAASFYGSERYAVRARQAVLTLLSSTKTDPAEASMRFTVFPSGQVNRLAAASLLVLAINELPEPGQDLLEQSEQLCQFIRKQQRADGSFEPGEAENPPGSKTRLAAWDTEASSYPGIAVLALLRSQAHKPAAWKSEAARKGFNQAIDAWRKEKVLAPVPWLTSAGVELYVTTKDRATADAVFEMNDWLCGLQYGVDPQRSLWQGGFRSVSQGKALDLPPGVESARCAEGLADACRVARLAVDLQRFARYRDASERCLHFLTTLQFTPANTRHFAEWYQPRLYGAFAFSHQDGNVRIDSTEHAVCSMTQYLKHVAQLPTPVGKAAKQP